MKPKKRHATYDFIVEKLLPFLPRQKANRIIDYGCGDASLAYYLPKGFISEYFGLDINENSIKVARSNHVARNFHFYHVRDKRVYPFSRIVKNADLVISIGVLQYLEREQILVFLKNSYSSLKPGGYLIVSTSVNHAVYRFLDLYRFLLPHRFVDRVEILDTIQKAGFDLCFVQERGLLLSPILMNFMSLFFDSIDKILFRNKGRLGPIGRKYREFASYLVSLEYNISIDYGYTLYIVARR